MFFRLNYLNKNYIMSKNASINNLTSYNSDINKVYQELQIPVYSSLPTQNNNNGDICMYNNTIYLYNNG